MSDNRVILIFQDKTGNLWFGTIRGGVNRSDGNSLTHFTTKEGLNNDYVTSIFEDKNGYLWIGTKGGGVYRYDGKSFMMLTEKEGLCNDVVYGIIEDKNENLWFGSPTGLSRLCSDYMMKLTNSSGKGNADRPVIFNTFTYEDGFLGIGCFVSILEDDKGTIWIGTNDRLTANHPEGDEPDSTAPNIQLTSIQLSTKTFRG